MALATTIHSPALLEALLPVALSAEPLATQALDPAILTETSAPVRAALSFLATVLFGGLVIYQYGGRLGPAVAASTDSPLHSVLYGIIAYGGGVFLFGYAVSQLFRVGVDARLLILVIGPLFALFVLVLGGVGFVVVGAWLTATFGTRSLWTGLIALGGLTSLGWLLLPALFAFVVWLSIAAIGVGGPVRRWMHADATRIESA